MPKPSERGKSLVNRLTGFSTPVFGASWTPAVIDVDVAQQVLSFLEDRRVLYMPHEVEVVDHVVRSVLDIRRFLTNVLGQDGIGKDLQDSLRAMRGACRQFLNDISQRGGYPWQEPGRPGWEDFELNQALGRLRGVVGVHVAIIADRYGLEVEAELASILPPEPE